MSSEQPDWGPRGADGVLVVEEEKTTDKEQVEYIVCQLLARKHSRENGWEVAFIQEPGGAEAATGGYGCGYPKGEACD